MTPSAPSPARRSHSARTWAGGQLERAVGVGQQHEVVLGAVALDERHRQLPDGTARETAASARRSSACIRAQP